jgi:hypothetical protein
VKDAFWTSHALAVYPGEEFNTSHIHVALGGIQNFVADVQENRERNLVVRTSLKQERTNGGGGAKGAVRTLIG